MGAYGWSRAARARAGVRRLPARGRGRHGSAGGVQLVHLAVRHARDLLDRAVRAVRVRDAQLGVARGRPEVPRAGLDRLRHPALRRGVPVRRHRARSGSPRSPRAWPRIRTACWRWPARRCVLAGPRLQDRRRPVPHVDARRVRGVAHARHRVHVGGHEGGGVRRAVPRAGAGPARDGRRLAAGGRGGIDHHDAVRQHRGAAADEPEADPGVLVGRPRGLPADGPGRRARRARRRCCSTWPSTPPPASARSP